MSTNFAYDQVPPEFEQDERPEPDDDEFFPPPDAETLGRPSAEVLTGATVALELARLEYLRNAARAREIRPQHAEFWEKRAADTQVAIEWLGRGAP